MTAGTGVMNIGSGQLYKDTSGNVGIGTATPNANTGTALVLYSTNTPRFRLTNSTTGQASGDGSEISLFSTGELIIENRESAATIFYNGGSERARIDSSGNFLVAKTTANTGTDGVQLTNTSGGRISSSASGADCATFNRNTSDGSLILMLRAGSIVGSISVTGSATAYNTSSDYRLKHDVQPMTSGLATISALKPVTYKWNADNTDGEGFIAHELKSVVPSAVSGEKDAVDAEGNIVSQGVDYSKIVVHLVAAIQELSAKNDALEARLAALEAK
jgi:hypothetical protein